MNQSVSMLDLKKQYKHMQTHIREAIERCLDHQKWILGPEVGELEEKIAQYIGTDCCVGASSGTEALVLALRALAISRTGNEFFRSSQKVITTAFTFTATGDAVLRSGATPVFVDIDPLTYNLDTIQVRNYLEQEPEDVVGIIPVHLYGRSCDMDGLSEIAREYDLFIVEDVAQAFGGTWRGKRLGSIGDAGAFSFFPSKNLGGFGDGGMVATHNRELADLTRMLIKHGGRDKYNVDHIGYNGRLDTLQAAVLLVKIAYIDDFNQRRRALAALYNQKLDGLQGINTPADDPGHVYHQYTIRVQNNGRDKLKAHLGTNNISSMIYYPHPLHRMGVFNHGRSVSIGDLANTEQACKSVLSLPMDPCMDNEVVDMVVQKVREGVLQT